MGEAGEGSVGTVAPTDDGPTPPGRTSEAREQLRGLARAVHPRQALLTGLALAAAAYVDGRGAGGAAYAGGAVLLVQLILGLVNDAGDAAADTLTARSGKPVAQGHLPASNATFVALCLALVAVPVSLANGWAAALALLGYLVLGLLSRTRLRRGWLSWLPWAAGFATLPAFLSYGGDGLGLHGGPPTWPVCVAAAVVGVGVHVLLALPDLVADNRTGTRHLPLRLALRVGATVLLVMGALLTAAAVAALVFAVASVGLRA